MITSFDLDGVLIDSHPLMFLALAEQGYMVVPEIDKYKIEFIEGQEPPSDFDWDLFYYKVFAERSHEIKGFEGCHKLLAVLSVKSNFGVIPVITNRPKGLLSHYVAESTLERLYPKLDFSVSISQNDKHRYMFGSKIIFEDRRRTAIDMASHGHVVFLKETSYNRIKTCNFGTFGHYLDIDDIISFDGNRIKPGTIINFRNYNELLDSRIIDFLAGTCQELL